MSRPKQYWNEANARAWEREMMKTDEYWPNIGIDIKVGVIETETGFTWNVFAHIQGPDDVFDHTSKEFQSKKECNLDMLEKALPMAMEAIASFE